MEYVAVEKEGLELLRDKLEKIRKEIEKNKPYSEPIDKIWIENAQLSVLIHHSLKTLQNYRERGILGFSTIGKKIYYQVAEISELIEKNVIKVENKDLTQKALKNYGTDH